MARMVTRSMKKGLCVRFPTGLSDKKKYHENRKRKYPLRVQVVYRNNLRSRLIQYVHFFGALVSYTYCLVIYIQVFLFIRKQKVWTQDPKQMIAY